MPGHHCPTGFTRKDTFGSTLRLRRRELASRQGNVLPWEVLVCRLLECRRSTVLALNRPDQMNEKEEIAEEILRYLIDHPNAQDTLKGVVTWWLLERTIKHKTALVKEVLDKLVADGLVIAQQGSDLQTLYKMNRRRRRKIISLLQH